MRAFVLGNYMSANFLYVDRLPTEGESVAADNYRQEHGGKGLNLAVGLRRLGAEVDLLMAVGADPAGLAVKGRIAEEGIDTSHVIYLGPTSGFGAGFIARDGRNFLAVHLGANALLMADHVRAISDVLSRADFALAQFEVPEPAIIEVFERARAGGIPTYLNPSPWRTPSRKLIDLADVVVVNATEAAAMLGKQDLVRASRGTWADQLPDLAAKYGWQGQLLVVTLSEAGCVALDRAGGVVIRAGYRVDQVDATGAGDAFGSGLVWALLQRLELPDALNTANACGALVTSRHGVLDSLPTSVEVEAFMAHAHSG
jgi:ribokinase